MQKIKRKIQEQYLAVELEKKMSKEQILEIYMSTINLGQNTLGVKLLHCVILTSSLTS